jgi:inhibitor of KinA
MEPLPVIFALGDAAITLDLGDLISEELNRKAAAIRDWLDARRYPGVEDIIVSYSSVSVFYDPVQVRESGEGCNEDAFGCMRTRLEEAWELAIPMPSANGEMIRLPVCYGGITGPDLDKVARDKGISPEEVVALHSARIYRVYMLGFLPGFCYLGKLDERLEMPRKLTPVPVVAGSLGIVGNQTGVYPFNSPGGWQIIGFTPVKFFDPGADTPVRLKIGDHVQFYPVTREELSGYA